jgi:pimeloyl-ACP methyl ester carboxylesterase
MAYRKRLIKSFLKLFLPVIILVVIFLAAGSFWLNQEAAHPQFHGYLVTPQKYGLLSSRGAQITDESWTGAGGVRLKGWLLRGAPYAPAVILLHRYGTDRSHVLNLGVKLNEATDFTVFMPDQRAHGPEPDQNIKCSLGGCETEDVLEAIKFLKNLKTPEGLTLVGRDFGIYGVEMGALAGLGAASAEKDVTALALDSLPASSDELLTFAIDRRHPFASTLTGKLAALGAGLYFTDGCYRAGSACDLARNITNRNVLIMAGSDSGVFQQSSVKVARCFGNGTKVIQNTELIPSGMTVLNASLESVEAYDQRVIDFFRSTLGQPPAVNQ